MRRGVMISGVAITQLLACGGGMGLDQYFQTISEYSCHKIFECCTAAEIDRLGDGLLSFSDEA